MRDVAVYTWDVEENTKSSARLECRSLFADGSVASVGHFRSGGGEPSISTLCNLGDFLVAIDNVLQRVAGELGWGELFARAVVLISQPPDDFDNTATVWLRRPCRLGSAQSVIASQGSLCMMGSTLRYPCRWRSRIP
mmetsp:Transcript_46565/g.148610  ORF Transcript_46565/g.148610 Transcript_46565/m.148610 type:complete len:137 (+) Transcript_46565:580-990(+)